MKRALALFLVLILLPLSGLADAARAVITIDGVRAAFFSADNAYLAPVEADGVLYVPALSLAESLGLEVTADPDTLAVTVSGVRTAFFGADGSYLPPRLENGQVYVPLAAFCEAAGIDLSVDGDTYALTRAGSVSAPPAVIIITPEPAPQYTPVPQYAYIELSKDNFSRFFNIESSYSSSKDYQQYPYIINYSVSCYPTVALDASNVSISVKVGGVTCYLTLNGSGNASDTARETFYPEGSATERILAVGSKLTSLILEGYTLNSVHGRIRVSWDQACEYYDPTYRRAENLLETDPAQAKRLFEDLARANWRDSAERAKEAEDAIDPVNFAQAEKAMQAGEWDKAIELLIPLKNKGYEGSAGLLDEAREKKNAEAYAGAQALLGEGKWDEAIAAFEALDGYSDSQDKAGEAREGKNAEAYAGAQALLEKGRWDEAIAAFEALGGYSDSQDKAGEAREGKNAENYAKAENLLSEGKWDAAISAFKALGGYSDSAARADEAREGKNAENYARAEKYLADEDFDAAISAFKALSVLGYRDSGERAAQASQAKAEWMDAAYGESYGAGLKALEENDFNEAVKALTAPAGAGYKDSADRLAEASEGAGILSGWTERYDEGIRLEQDKKWAEALAAFEQCLPFRNAQAHAAYCLLKAGAAWMTAPYSGAVAFIRNNSFGLLNTKTGRYRYITLQRVYSTELWNKGLLIVAKDGKTGMMDSSGRWVVKAAYGDYTVLDKQAVAFKDSEGWHFFSLKGKALTKDVFLSKPAALPGGGLYVTSTLKGIPCAVSKAGKVTTARKDAEIWQDSDGSVWYRLKSGGKQVIYNSKGRVKLTAKLAGAPAQVYAMGYINDSSDEKYFVCKGVVAYSEDGSHWGLYDLVNEKPVMKPGNWTCVSRFTADGVLRFIQAGKLGVANSQGRTLAGARYDGMGLFYSGMAKASLSATLKNRDGKNVKGVAYGFVNAQGREVVPVKYHEAGDFSVDPEHACVRTIVGVFPGNRSLQRFGYLIVDKNGKTVLQIEIKDQDVISCRAAAPGFFYVSRRYGNYVYAVSGDSYRVSDDKTLLDVGSGVLIGTVQTTSYGKTVHIVNAITDARSKELDRVNVSVTITRVGPMIGGIFALTVNGTTTLHTKKLNAPNLTRPEKKTGTSAADLKAVREAMGK